MKKTLLELSFDDESMKYDLISEFDPLEGLEPFSLKCAGKSNDLIEKLVETLLDKSNPAISRLMTIADICSDSQPYDHIEQLWSMMMFDYLPEYEKYFRKMKEQRGLCGDVIEPVRFVNTDFIYTENSEIS